MEFLQQGVAITWGFGVVVAFVVLIQIWSWIVYSQYLTDIKVKRLKLQQETNPQIKQNLLDQFAITQSPLGSRIQLVNEALLRKRSVGIQELSLLTEEEDSRQWHVIIPNTSISIFLIAGLAGTIYLLETLLGRVFDKGDIVLNDGTLVPDRMAEVINTIYKGFSHVFVVTFAGIVCTLLVLIVRNLFIHRKRSEFFQEIDKFTLEFLLPLDIKLTDVLAPFIKSMDDLASTIMDSSRKNADAIDKASNANAEAIEKSARLNMEIGLVNLQNAKTALEAVNNLGQFSTTMNEAAREMRLATKSLASTNTILSATFAADGQWAKLHDALLSSQTKLKDSVDDVQLKISSLCADVAGLRNAAETLAVVDYQDLQTHLGGLSSHLKATDEVLTQLRQTYETLLMDLVNSPNSLNNTFITLNKTAANIGPQLIQGQTHLNTTLDGFSGSLVSIDQNLPELQSRLHKTSTHLLQLCASITDLNKANFQGLHDGINGLDSSLRTAGEAYTSMVKVEQEISNEMANRQAALRLSFESLETNMEELKQQIITSRHLLTDSSITLKNINTSTAALAGIDFPSLQQKLDALLTTMTTSTLLKVFPSLQKEMTELSTLLQTWIKSTGAEQTPDKLDDILAKLHKIEIEKSKAEKRGWFQ